MTGPEEHENAVDAKTRLLRWWKRILSDEPPREEDDEDRRSLEEWQDLVEQRIREAMERGEFDNLSVQGKPLVWEHNPFVEPEDALTYRLLKDQGFVPRWIEERKALEEDIADLRVRVRQAWHRHMRRLEVLNARDPDAYETWQERRTVEARWEETLAAFREEIAELNRRIDTYNLMVPVVRFQMFRVRLEDML
ncbi:MAG: DUF1992 domain-containing protein [Chloroflexi bacterium]|nr:DUF1992 domain-containing protein [Chloroflexota bacterium]